MDEKLETIWKYGFSDIHIMRGVFCWYVILDKDKQFYGMPLSEAVDKALKWASENKRI